MTTGRIGQGAGGATAGETFRPHPIEWTPERVGRLWDYYASNPAYKDHYFSKHSGASILQAIGESVDLRGRRVLDFGCGPGFMLERILEQGIRASGVEFSERSVREATERLRRFPSFEGVTRAERVPTPLADSAYDAVLCVEVVEHLFDDQLRPALQEIRRLLKPGGVAVVTTPNEERMEAESQMCPECGCVYHRWQHLRRWDAATLARTMEECGFDTLVCKATRFQQGARPRPLRQLKRSLRRLLGSRRPPDPTPHLIYMGRRR